MSVNKVNSDGSLSRIAGGSIYSFAPIGAIVPYASSKIPEGYLLCDGREISRTEYAGLFAVIGTAYGTGDGSTTFNIPDLRGKFAEGTPSGESVGTVKSAGLPNITGSIGAGVTDANPSLTGAFSGSVLVGTYGQSGNTMYRVTENFDASKSNSIYGNSTTVQPPAVCINYIIKAKDVAMIGGTQTLADKVSDLESNVTELQENEYERLHINSYTAQTIKISGFQALTSGASGETFLLRERGGETILLSFGDNSQDVNVSWNYNALRIAEGAKKITALNFDYENRDLYVTLSAFGALDFVQIGGVKDNLTYTAGATVPSDNVYSIPIKTVTADNNFSTTPTEILTSASTYTVTEDVVLVKAVLATTETQYSGAEFVINGISVAAIGANSANSAVSQQNTFKCYKGDVLSKNVNTVGGAMAGSCRVYVFKHA